MSVNSINVNANLNVLPANLGAVDAIQANVGLNAIGQIAQENAQPINPARLTVQSGTARSRVNVTLSLKTQTEIGLKFALLDAKIKERIGDNYKVANITPKLDTLVIRNTDNNTIITLHADELDPEMKAIYQDLKLIYLEERSGNPSRANFFKGNEKGGVHTDSSLQLNGSFYDASAESFLNHQFPAISSQMSEERKIQVKEEILKVEILVSKKKEAFERLIGEIKTKIANTNDVNEKQQLQDDLKKLEKKLVRLKQVHPYALYWLVAFRPAAHGEDARVCRIQAQSLKQAVQSLTGDQELAKNLGGVLIRGRENYFYYCSANNMTMKSTAAAEKLLQQVIEENDSGIQVNGYASNYVRTQIGSIKTALDTEITNVVNQANIQREPIIEVALVANKLKDERIEKYQAFVQELDANDPHRAVFNEHIQAMQEIRENDVKRLLSYYEVIPANAPKDHPMRIAQTEKIERLRKEAKHEGYTDQEIENWVAKLKSGPIRSLLHDAQSLLPHINEEEFARSRINLRWPNLAQNKKDALIAIEAEICKEAKNVFVVV